MMPPAPTLSPEAKYRLLLKLSQEIGRSLDLQEVMEYLLESVRTAVEFDAAGVFVLNRRVPLGQDTGGRLIAGMATVGFDDTPRDEDPMLRRGEGIIGHVIATGQTVIAPDVRLNPHYVQGKASTLSEIAVPIVSGGEVIGALNLESDTLDAFSDADVEYLEFFAVAAAISIEKAVLHREMIEKHRIEQQLSIAKEVQAALLPAADPVLDGYDIAGTNVPTWEIGGDYYDYLPQADGRLGVVIADVSGKGVPAALIMATFRAALRAQRVKGITLDAIAGRLNRILLDSMDASRFVTAFYGLLEPRTGAIGFVELRAQSAVAAARIRIARRAGQRRPGPGHVGRGHLRPGRGLGPAGRRPRAVHGRRHRGHERGGRDVRRRAPRARDPAGPRRSSRQVVEAVVDATRAFAGRAGYDDDFTLVIVRRTAGAAAVAP